MPRLTLSLLGPKQVLLDGKPLRAFTYNKAVALLAYLAVEASVPHSRQELAGLLWPELPTSIRQRVERAREMQQVRFAKLNKLSVQVNGAMGPSEVQKFCVGDKESLAMIRVARERTIDSLISFSRRSLKISHDY